MAEAEPKASTLDGTLSAIVAADRLGLPGTIEGKELLHRRLTVFYAYFALVGALGVIAGGAKQVLADVDPRVLGFVLDVQIAHALVLCATFVALRFRVREPRLVRALDVFATVSTSVTAAVALSVVPRALSVDVSAVSFFILFFVLRAALVPSQPWLATLVAAVCAIPFTFGLANMYRLALVPDPEQATSAALRAISSSPDVRRSRATASSRSAPLMSMRSRSRPRTMRRRRCRASSTRSSLVASRRIRSGGRRREISASSSTRSDGCPAFGLPSVSKERAARSPRRGP